MSFPIPYNLPPFYKSSVIHLMNEVKAFPDIKKQRQIFERFCRKFTMITELWEYWAWLETQQFANPQQDEKLQQIIIKLKYRCMKHLNHEKSMRKIFRSFSGYWCKFDALNSKYLFKLLNTQKHDYVAHCCRAGSHEKQIAAVKKLEKRFNIPHSKSDETLKMMDKFLVTKTDKTILSTYHRSQQLYDKIMAADSNDYEWIMCLAEADDMEFFVQNIECKIAKNPGNVYLWNLYIGYLNGKNNIKVLNVYRKFCRIFIEDVETQKSYQSAVYKFNKAGFDVTKYIIDVINFELDFGLVKHALALLVDALNMLRFHPKRIFTFAKKFVKKYGYHGKIKNAVEKCKLRLDKSKYSMDFDLQRDLKITVDEIDPFDVSASFSQNIAQQYLDFPRSIYNYILDYTSYELYSKLIKTCKFFFVQKNFVIPVWYLQCHESIHRCQETFYYQNNLYINLTRTPSLTNPATKTKFWIGRNLVYNSMVDINPSPFNAYKIKPAIYQSNIEYLHMDKTTIDLSDYNFLTDKGLIKKIRLIKVFVKRNEKEYAALEDLMETLPNAYEIMICLQNRETSITTMTAQKLLNLKRNEDIQEFTMDCHNDLLDPKLFVQFIKKNAAPKSYFVVYYKFTEAHKNVQHFQDLVNEAHQLQSWWAPNEEAPKINIYLDEDGDD